jgi:hypothetical protein
MVGTSFHPRDRLLLLLFRKDRRHMAETALSALASWQNFYVIVGSSAGALTGLQFVVITLIAEARVPSSMREIRAFGSPTTVHFCMALLISAVLSCPWRSLPGLAAALGACGVGGVVYGFSAIGHAKRQTGYQPDWEDWMWFGWLPPVVYAVLALAALALMKNAGFGLFLVALVSLALLFLGIHNSWDTVTYIVIQHPQRGGKKETP